MTQFDPFFLALGSLGVLIFIVTSMLGMGFGLTVNQIMTPLKNRRLVIMSLVANFVLVPLLALLIVWIIPLPEGLRIGADSRGFRCRSAVPAEVGSGGQRRYGFHRRVDGPPDGDHHCLPAYSPAICTDRSAGESLGDLKEPYRVDAHSARCCPFHPGQV